jgi:DNA-binding transcriptional ArsR family regulator
MTQLADILGITPARLGNHLARLRSIGLVTTERSGRHVGYRAAQQDLRPLLDGLATFAGGTIPVPYPVKDHLQSCYDHAAGVLGVGIMETLLERNALTRSEGAGEAALRLGPAAGAVLADFGVDIEQLGNDRRVLASPCLDRLLRRPHLGGSLGAAVLSALLERGLVHQVADSRELRIDSSTRHTLAQLVPGLAT